MKEHLKGQYGEDAVNYVATNTFLKYWCYPNPKDENGNGKEICDLLVLFKDKALIISVKNYKFNGDHEKYFRLTLKKAVAQVSGAERKLFELDGQIIFNHEIRDKHTFDPKQYTTIHRIIVNLSTEIQFYPGAQKSKKRKIVHVFNWFAFNQVLNELNTISDFFQYLKEREKICEIRDLYLLCATENDWNSDTSNQFFRYLPEVFGKNSPPPTLLFSGTELDLLAVYLSNVRQFDPAFYDLKFNLALFELDGYWKKYLERKVVQNKKREEEISYFWDEIVKREVLYYEDELRIKIASELLALDRYQRRLIGNEFWEFIQKHKNKTDNYMARCHAHINDCVIAFFIYTDTFFGDPIADESVSELLKIAGQGYLEYIKHDLTQMVMICTNVKLTKFKFLYIEDAEPLKGEELKELQSKLNELKWFKNLKFEDHSVKEYPDE